jgi:dipeptidyl aminopeptidase/acylaminoacyl peptidase
MKVRSPRLAFLSRGVPLARGAFSSFLVAGAAVGLTALAACGGEEVPPPKAPEPPPPVATAAPAPVASVEPPKAPRTDASLYPRSLFFANPTRSAPELSPDGKRLAFLAEVNGVMNLFEGPADDFNKAKAVTNETKRNLRTFFWALDGAHLVYQQDKGGNENFHLHVVDLKAGTTKDVTPFEKARSEIVQLSPKLKGEMLVMTNDRDPRFFDVYRVSLTTGERTLVFKNDEGYEEFQADDDFVLHFARKGGATAGSKEIVELDKKGVAKPFLTVPVEDSWVTAPIAIDATGSTLYMRDSRDRDTAALVAIDAKTKKRTVVLEDPKADVGFVQLHPLKRTPQAAAFERGELVVKFADKAVEADYAVLRKAGTGDMVVTSESLDDKTWIAQYTPTDGARSWVRYDRATKKVTPLFVDRPDLEGKKLAKLQPKILKARDGLELVSYLTLPASEAGAKPAKPLPLVLLVHGGPWARDALGYNATHQWLASRGYAVLSVNYRGSTGSGKAFLNAGNKEWAGKMHTDLLDAVDWATKEGIADPKKVAIMGGSYGGYATLVGLTYTPDAFACGVDIVGPSNLETLIASVPPYWTPLLDQFYVRMGDPRTDDGKKLLKDRSPLHRASAIKKPLLIGQGANDPRVKQAESDQIVKAMQEKNIPVTYVLYPDEGHGFVRAENRKSFNAVAETFLASCLGGPAQPVGDDFKGSTISVPVGASQIYGLETALGKK